MSKFRINEYIAFKHVELRNAGIAQIIDITGNKYVLDIIPFLANTSSDPFDKEFIERECISLGTDVKTIEILYLKD